MNHRLSREEAMGRRVIKINLVELALCAVLVGCIAASQHVFEMGLALLP